MERTRSENTRVFNALATKTINYIGNGVSNGQVGGRHSIIYIEIVYSAGPLCSCLQFDSPYYSSTDTLCVFFFLSVFCMTCQNVQFITFLLDGNLVHTL